MKVDIKLLLNQIKRNKLLFLAVLACIVPILIYVIRFHSYNFSKDPADWGTFGDYIGGVYSVLLSIIAIYVTYMISNREDKAKEKRKVITELYKQVSKIKSEDVDLIRVNNIVSLTESQKHLLPKVLYTDIIKYSDYLKEIYNQPGRINISKEKRIKEELIEYLSE